MTSGPFAWAHESALDRPATADRKAPDMTMMTMTHDTSRPARRLDDADVRVLLLENIHADGRDFLRGKGYQVETNTGALGEDELIEAIQGVHLLGIGQRAPVRPHEDGGGASAADGSGQSLAGDAGAQHSGVHAIISTHL